MTLEDIPWFNSLDPVRRDVIKDVRIDRLNKPMAAGMDRHDYIGAAYELWNTLRRQNVSCDDCQRLANALEYGRWS